MDAIRSSLPAHSRVSGSWWTCTIRGSPWFSPGEPAEYAERVCCEDSCVPKGEGSSRCANNSEFIVPCAEGGDSCRCPERSPVCCRDGDGDPHDCSA
jgi:hypothetical protein